MPRYHLHTNRVYYGLVLIIDGARDYCFTGCFDDRVIRAEPGNLLWLPKHSCYRLDDITPCKSISFNFELVEELECEPFLYPAGAQLDSYIELFQTAYLVWSNDLRGTDARLHSLLYQIIYLMQSHYRPDYVSPRVAEWVNHAVDCINRNYMDPALSVSGLAKECGVSDSYFRRIFERMNRLSPVKYIQRVRTRRAIELLETDSLTIREIASLVGYENDYYFSRVFKSQTGFSPTQYNKSKNHGL